MYTQAQESLYVHIVCTSGDTLDMTYDDKVALARTGDFSKEAAAVRLRAARMAAGLSQEELGKAAGISKAAISNSEKALSFPGRSALIFLYQAHRIDLNFTMAGQFAQLPGDIQEALFSALAAGDSAPSQRAS